jgi:hypothetical protein
VLRRSLKDVPHPPWGERNGEVRDSQALVMDLRRSWDQLGEFRHTCIDAETYPDPA